MSDEEKKYERIKAPCKFYDPAKGYGFLKRPSKMDVYFSRKALEESGIREIKENDMLEFDLVPVIGKGGKAIHMKKVKNV